VSLESSNPVVPYSTWATAATNIQDAVDAAKDGDTVLVTNGVCAVRDREVSMLDTFQQPPQLESVGLSRVVVTNSIRLESVNGPLVTTIMGTQVLDQHGEATNRVRCAFLQANAVVSGFTLTNGAAEFIPGDEAFSVGGGVFCAGAGVVTNCTITGNVAGSGGGA
jgi:hypothetical protein